MYAFDSMGLFFRRTRYQGMLTTNVTIVLATHLLARTYWKHQDELSQSSSRLDIHGRRSANPALAWIFMKDVGEIKPSLGYSWKTSDKSSSRLDIHGKTLEDVMEDVRFP